jgi:hypothetical protein
MTACWPRAAPEWLAQVTAFRANRPLRMRILATVSGPGTEEMFDYPRTVIAGMLESGTARIGEEILIPLKNGGTIRERVTANWLGRRGGPLRQLSAGQEPFIFDMMWARYYPRILPEGTIVAANPV